MKNTKVLVAQPGARKHYQEPLLFHRWGILDKLYTDFYSGHSVLANLLRYPRIYKHLPNLLKKGLDRYEPGLKNADIIHFPLLAYQAIQALKKAPIEEAGKIYAWGGKAFCQRFINRGLGNANTIYGFNSTSLELFEYAKQQRLRCILDQTQAERSFVHQILQEEEKLWQGWSLSPFTINDGDLELLQREQGEQDLADKIICGSNFVKDSLIARGVDANKIFVLPIGRLKDENLVQAQGVNESIQQDELKILFAGSVGLRKGIPYLLEALRKIKGKIPFTCKIAGTIEIKLQRVNEYSNVCEFLGRVSRSQIKDLYTWADVFILPSICEGSAMVTYEAMSFGLPIITTPNSGSIVRDGIDGFIVPIRNISAIADKILKVYNMGNSLEKKANIRNYLQDTLKDSESKLLQTLTYYA
ncbi:MAG: glycosyltransferase family 4 protein [Calothrix sp. FI2-JRJ7]|jgi:glycosyltransferase involved in cell wall biosynthesis|nr:glycosyltransferase family 4 protein [Calothrix sp. FI2-JRJ7]